jgi:hypothetical protein
MEKGITQESPVVEKNTPEFVSFEEFAKVVQKNIFLDGVLGQTQRQLHQALADNATMSFELKNLLEKVQGHNDNLPTTQTKGDTL